MVMKGELAEVRDASPEYAAQVDMPLVPEGYKQTEVGVIPENWASTTLGCVSTMKSGESITSARINLCDGYPCYGGNGLRGYTDQYTHEGEYALIGRQGALCGNVVGVKGQFFASEHAVVVTPRSGTDIRWLTYVLGEMNLNRFSESSAQPGLSVSKVLGLPLAQPRDKVEQRAIATTLSDVDALLKALDRLIAKKRDIKQATMQQLLTAQTRLLGFEGEWEGKRLGDICTMKSGAGITSSAIDDHSQFPCYGGNGLRGRTSSFTHEGRFALIGRQGALCGNVIPVKGKFFASEHALVVTPLPEFDVQWLTYVLGRMNLNQYSESSAQPGLSAVKLLELHVHCPPTKDEQAAIAAVLAETDAQIEALQQRRTKTTALKQAMMQELLTGRTRLL